MGVSGLCGLVAVCGADRATAGASRCTRVSDVRAVRRSSTAPIERMPSRTAQGVRRTITRLFTGLIYTYGYGSQAVADPHTHTEAGALRLPNGSGQRGTLTPAPRQLPRARPIWLLRHVFRGVLEKVLDPRARSETESRPSIVAFTRTSDRTEGVRLRSSQGYSPHTFPRGQPGAYSVIRAVWIAFF